MGIHSGDDGVLRVTRLRSACQELWWEWKGPDRTAEIVSGSGLSRTELSALLDRIEAENMGRPYIVTRTKQLYAVFAKARRWIRHADAPGTGASMC